MGDTADRKWPLTLTPEEGAFVALCCLYVAMPYGGLDSDQARAVLASDEFRGPMSEFIPDAASLVESGQEWRLLERIASTVTAISQERRDAIGIEIVLGDDFIPEGLDIDYALYWRRVDVSLEAISSNYASSEVINILVEAAEWLAQESKSMLMSTITSGDIVDLAEIAHQSQAYVTGIYIPFAADALRWGQRQLGNLTDQELILAVAADAVRLQHREVVGDMEAIRTYGALLSDDIREMSTSQAHGRTPDQRAKQIRVFTTLLRKVSEALGEDDDGLATDVAPDFEGMRLNEVYELANAMAISLEELDGQQDSEDTGRSVWNADNWYVKGQAPAAGQPLGRRRRVRVWVLKHTEHSLSAFQRSNYAKTRDNSAT